MDTHTAVSNRSKVISVLQRHSTDKALLLWTVLRGPRISRVAISSGRARTISRNLVHALKARSVLETFDDIYNSLPILLLKNALHPCVDLTSEMYCTTSV